MILNLVSGQKDTNGNNNAILGAWNATSITATGTNADKIQLNDCFNINNEYFSYNETDKTFTVLKDCTVQISANAQKGSMYGTPQGSSTIQVLRSSTHFEYLKNGNSIFSFISNTSYSNPSQTVIENLHINDILQFRMWMDRLPSTLPVLQCKGTVTLIIIEI